jgi:hypothetical protein
METKLCKKCGETKSHDEFSNSKAYKDGKQLYCKACNKAHNDKYNADNREYFKEYTKYYMSKNKDRYKELMDTLFSSIPAGIYAIYHDDELVYVGSSSMPRRRLYGHFVNSINANNSSIARAMAKGILKGDKLRFEMLEYVDDRDTRLEKERSYIRKLQPKLNKNSK